VGLAVLNTASVTIRNYAPVNICGLTLSPRLVKNYSGIEIVGGDANVDPLGAGERRKIDVDVFTTFGNILTHLDCVVVLMSGNTVLDNWTSNIS